MQSIKIIAFDADDTLWVNEPHYRNCENQAIKLLSPYGTENEIMQNLFQTEMQNLATYGYGAKSFALSMIETALKFSNFQISPTVIGQIIKLGKELINQELELLPDVKDVLAKLAKQYPLVLATKGDLLDQERKLSKSGLDKCFHHIEVMSDKKKENYARLLKNLNCLPEEFLMLGNSLKSDIIPVLELGGQAIYIPYHTTWEHERLTPEEIAAYNIIQIDKLTEVFDFLK
jgi:putative hydrolase of the HAD superfamily